MVSRRVPATRSMPLRMTPLAAALAACWPLWVVAAKPPAPSAVPIPSASWRVYGNGSAAPVNTPNALGGVDQAIRQDSQRAIYQWQSFDIGANSSVTFDMALKNSSALNRVLGGTAPSQIFGKLKATNGGEIYLINANGILFGRGAQVNTGSLIASALNVSDDEFLSGLTNSLLYHKDQPAFAYDGAAGNFVDSKNFVRVDEGASITTANGGRVFLFAKRVENAGQITTPGGQTMLAAGGKIWLQAPADNPLYASEANASVPTLRGLLVEVGAGPAGGADGVHGSAVNTATGEISTPRGNATIVAMAVNQSGRVSATTSVTENGSIILRAQGGARSDGDRVKATHAGELVLGAGSQTTISPDSGKESNGGEPLTSDGNATFVNPRIDLAGASVLLDKGAQVIAPGAVVDVRAAITPDDTPLDSKTYSADLAGPPARIVLAEGAVIDVSGTTTATDSVSRFFVTTGLLGSNDLKDAPLQKDGLLYRSKVTVDVREDSAILGSLEGYRDGLQQTIEERLSSGGKVSLVAGDGVYTHAGSRIDVSGGQVAYTAAEVRETQLIGTDGKVYDLNSAPADQVYSTALNLQKGSAAGFDRWGVKVNFGALTPTRHEEGYVEGRAAGSLSIVAPQAVLLGDLQALTTSGTRQDRGDDAQAARGSFSVGAVRQGGQDVFGKVGQDAVLRQFNITTLGPQFDQVYWDDPLGAPAAAASGVKHSELVDAGFGAITVAAVGDVSVLGLSDTTPLDLGDQASLRALSTAGDVRLGGALRSAGGSVELESQQGRVELAAGASVNLSGRWINTLQDGPRDTAATAGGNFSATGFEAVELRQGSLIDVSGGAVVSATGGVSGTGAGSIALATRSAQAGAGGDTVAEPTGLVLDGGLRGQSLGNDGGSLSLKAPRIAIADSPAPEAGTLGLGSAAFSQGGFSSFSVDGYLSLDVAKDTTLTLQRDEWLADPRLAALAPSGSNPFAVASPGHVPGQPPAAMSLTLASSGDGFMGGGELGVAEGAAITAPALSSVSLKASNRLLMDGEIATAGGKVALSLSTKRAVQGDTTDTTLWLGAHSRIDVSGTVIRTPGNDGLQRGEVLAGGTIQLSAQGVSGSGAAPALVVQQGAQLVARGAAAELDRSVLSQAGVQWQRESVGSDGGTLAVTAAKVLVMEGQVALQGGGHGASGGTLAVQLNSEPVVGFPGAPENALHELRIGAGPTEKTGGVALGDLAAIDDLDGTASVSAATIAASGASNATLGARDRVRFLAGADLALDGTLTLQSRALAVQPDQQVTVAAGQVALQGLVPQDGAPTLQATEGTGALTLQSRGGLAVRGHWVTSGLHRLALQADGDMMLAGPDVTHFTGSLVSAGDMALAARQIYPTTGTDFHIATAGRDVTITGTDKPAGAIVAPLSAGGRLQIDAATITQGGVVRAPQGQIALQASESLQLAAGSETSVSASGVLLPYGTTAGGQWLAPDKTTVVSEVPAKRIDLDAPEVSINAGAALELGGGGDLVAYEFVAGRGGSTDVFAGGQGTYALVPGVQTAAIYDTSLAGHAAQGRLIEIGEGAPVPAGTYTLLPARYALQPGAFLIEPVSSGTAFALGTTVAQADGSAWVGARLRTEGTGAVDSQTSTWRISSRTTARQRSEIRETSANQEWAERAAADGALPAERPIDAGTLSLAATLARIDGNIAMTGAANGGRGGRAEFVAGRIAVTGDGAGNGATGSDGTLGLSVATLNSLGAQTVVLGGRSGAATAEDGSIALQVSAATVDIDTGSQALALQDLVVAATETIAVADGSAIVATGAGAGVSATYSLEGDGAAMRVSAQRHADLSRHGASGSAGEISVGARSRVEAGGGSLVIEATTATQLAASTQLDAADITLGAHDVKLGGPAGAPGVLSMTPQLLSQVGDAEQLTLRAYHQINVTDGTRLGEGPDGQPTLNALVLDAPLVRVAGATGEGARITAGEITLTNSSDLQPQVPTEGAGRLALHASQAAGGSGQLKLADGALVINGAESVEMTADAGIVLTGASGRLATDGDLHLLAAGIVAGTSGAAQVLHAGGELRLAAQPGTVVPASELGASLALQGERIDMSGGIVLPAGSVEMRADDGLVLGAGSRIDVSGRQVAVGEAQVDLAGGSVHLHASAGDLTMSGGVINVSGAGDAAGGSLALAAPAGQVEIRGQLRGAGSSADGARLSVDSGQALDVAALMRHVNDSVGAGFTGAIHLRQREGDLEIGPQTALHARDIAVSADAGALTVRGELNADGVEGGRIALAARDDLALAPGAQLSARATSEAGDGGRVSLDSTAGRLRLQAGSSIALDAGAEGDAGRLALRAQRLGIDTDSPAGNEVDIAPIASTISGAGRIDVEAVKVYDGIGQIAAYGWNPPPDTLLMGTLDAEGLAFVGHTGARAESMAERLSQGDEALKSLIRVHAGAELRSEGNLTTDANTLWVLPDEASRVANAGGNAAQVGNTSLTLRAAGDLQVRHGISSGFDGFDRAQGDAAGSIRLIAGADLSAAEISATQAGQAADLTLARTSQSIYYNDLSVRTTTGDVVLAASGDVRLNQGRVSVYTAGVITDDAKARALLNRALPSTAVAFATDAGDVRVQAGGDVIGRSVWVNPGDVFDVAAGHADQWTRVDQALGVAYWATDVNSTTFERGLGSFGGGQVRVQAGGDVVDLIAASPSSGYVDQDGAVHRYGGGSVRVEAGRDVVGGVLQAGAAELEVSAGRDIIRRESPVLGSFTDGLWLNYENTAVRVQARRDLTIGAAQSSHAVLTRWLSGLDADASLEAAAAAGDLVFRGDAEDLNSTLQALVFDSSASTFEVLPTRVAFSAPVGSVTLGTSGSTLLQQAQRADARFDALAGENLVLGNRLQINASAIGPATYLHDRATDNNGEPVVGSAFEALAPGALRRGDGESLDRSDREPVRLIAAHGDIELNRGFSSARPVRAIAGGDIALGESLAAIAEIQHQDVRFDSAGAAPSAELSLFQAGRDIDFGRSSLAIAGPGDLVLLAGRDIDLGRGRGVQSVGNIDNASRLAPGSAGVTLVAGLRADGNDYAKANLRGFAALGAAAMQARSGDLYAWLSAADGTVPALGSATAREFAVLPVDGQLDRVQALLGDAAYEAAVARYVRGLVGHGQDTDAQALKAFESLSEVKRAAAPGALLADAFGGLAVETRHAFVAQVAAADTPTLAAGLVDFVAAQTGQRLGLAEALTAFEALPAERQMLRVNEVLVSELRTHGRAAVAAELGSDKEAAYDRGYATVNAVFPVDEPGRPAGEVSLPSAQLRTLQGSGITVLTPGGGLNAGEAGSSGRQASELGIVTVAGGDIAGVARGDILVNQSRIFTLGQGDILLWSSTGDVDAGRGAKTVVGAPAPVFRLDANGRIVVDTSGSFSGSGIAVLDADSALDLYAPAGAIDAGEAGIRALGTVTLGADVVRGADDIVGGSVAGAPPAASTVGATAALAQAADAASNTTRPGDDDEEERRRKRRARRQLLLEFLGFGQG